jgi:hypothetical protein
MTVELCPAEEGPLFYIIAHMRECDRREIFCTRWDDDPASLADDCMNVIGRANSLTVLATLDREPVAVLGAVETWPGTWDVWCFGTDQFEKVAFTLTKYVRRTLIPALLVRGLRRGHCRSLADHVKAHAWLRELGAKSEDERPMKSWGKNGEDFVMFEWHRHDLLKTFRPEAA